MNTFLHIIAVIIGVIGLFIYFRSVIRVMLLNWHERDVISYSAGRTAVRIVRRFTTPGVPYEQVQRTHAWIFPLFVILSVVSWFLLVQVAFTLILWGVNAEANLATAFTASGSALSTLGFKTPPSWLGELLAIFEGGMGLAIVVLLFSFVPGYLAAIQVRERKVGWLYNRTGRHPTCVSLYDALAASGNIADAGVWEDWETWFRGIYETHATAPILAYVPSIYRGTNWVGASAAILDLASFVMSVIEPTPAHPARMCRLCGVRTVKLLGDSLKEDAPLEMVPDLPQQMSAAFDKLYDKLAQSGASISTDKEKCRETFLALRAEYESSLRQISSATLMPIEKP